ncbi:MAG: RNA methyltransferase [Gomphosphaeria aponina SAG 52.96 = DSM 107014]|uniref:RNA methyltransferase n=1 Tax=Gomphosphaeria aponina SAG 52.96 = DSM 107014 TaxID=1521640 RepID=A0A941GXS7_9CHRO|nr:RNA methyltransferase [Gomphosphaeria aponina SAG 52.96 = DSM 107014]
MNKYFATVARGLETIAAQELETLGAKNVNPDFTGVHFTGDQELLYKVNLWGRTFFRVLMVIGEIKAHNAEQLYQSTQNIHWDEFIEPNNTIAVKCTGKNNNLNHTHFTALQIKNAIVDQQQSQTGERSNIDVENPDLLINAHIRENLCILSLDSSGYSLHKRGYRPAMGLAPLKETLAAALLKMAEWEPSLAFCDPLCGSGILPIEATLIGLNIAPGLFSQSLGFERWRDFDQGLWESLLQEATNSELSALKAPISGSDSDPEIIQQARYNAKACGVEHQVKFACRELAEIEAPADSGVIICNPPYGIRLGDVQELAALYKLLGDVFKQRFKGWNAYVLTGNKELAKKVGLRASRRIPVYNGTLPCTLLKYELY